MVEKYYNNEGKVGIIISPDFGAGWSTWDSEHAEELLFDKTLVEMILKETPYKEIEKYASEKWPDVYTGGLATCEVEFLEPETRFTVHEYDGAESIRTIEDLKYTA